MTGRGSIYLGTGREEDHEKRGEKGGERTGMGLTGSRGGWVSITEGCKKVAKGESREAQGTERGGTIRCLKNSNVEGEAGVPKNKKTINKRNLEGGCGNLLTRERSELD